MSRNGESGEWCELSTFSKDSKTSGDVACQSEGIAGLSLLPAVRQGVPRGRTDVRLRTLQGQGAAGVDGQYFEDIETDGVERWLVALVAPGRRPDLSAKDHQGKLLVEAGNFA